jgi:cell division protein FtsB
MRFKMGKEKNSFAQGRWFFLLLSVGALVYVHAMNNKSHLYEEMTLQLADLTKKKEEALQTREELALQIQSQSDPAWVEMVLKRNLGMVREGQMKVYFQAE